MIKRSHTSLQPRVRPNACQNLGSRNVSSTGTIKEESLSVLVHAEYSSLAPIYEVAMPSEPCMWYPPSLALSMASWIIIIFLFAFFSLHLLSEERGSHCETHV